MVISLMTCSKELEELTFKEISEMIWKILDKKTYTRNRDASRFCEFERFERFGKDEMSIEELI